MVCVSHFPAPTFAYHTRTAVAAKGFSLQKIIYLRFRGGGGVFYLVEPFLNLAECRFIYERFATARYFLPAITVNPDIFFIP